MYYVMFWGVFRNPYHPTCRELNFILLSESPQNGAEKIENFYAIPQNLLFSSKQTDLSSMQDNLAQNHVFFDWQSTWL